MPPQIDLPDVSFADVQEAAARLDGVVHRTPVMTSRTVDTRTGAQTVFKCESFQRAGSFKIRGAYNTLSQLAADDKEHGVLAYSSGNHAQAVALASRVLDLPAAIIMPNDAPRVKLEATRGYGAEVILYDRADTTREELANEVARERNRPIIPPYDHPDIVAGQGTVAVELFEEVGALDVLLVPCGGGGLLSGCALAADRLAPGCKVIGVEPQQANDAARSFRTGTLKTVHNPDTIADGARTPSLGNVTFPLVLEYVDDLVTVSEDAIRHATRFLWERMKLVAEPTGALAAAALLDGVVPGENRRIGVVISGGNTDFGF